MCQITTVWVNGASIKDIAFYVQKHITPCTDVISSLLVRDKPVEAPASVKRVYNNIIAIANIYMNTNLIDVDKYTRRESIKNANTCTTEQNKLNRVYFIWGILCFWFLVCNLNIIFRRGFEGLFYNPLEVYLSSLRCYFNFKETYGPQGERFICYKINMIICVPVMSKLFQEQAEHICVLYNFPTQGCTGS